MPEICLIECLLQRFTLDEVRSDEIKAEVKADRGREAIKPLLVLAMSGLSLRQGREDGKLSHLKRCSCLNRRWSEQGRKEDRFYLPVWMKESFSLFVEAFFGYQQIGRP